MHGPSLSPSLGLGLVVVHVGGLASLCGERSPTDDALEGLGQLLLLFTDLEQNITSAVQCSAVQHSAEQCSAAKCSAVQCSEHR